MRQGVRAKFEVEAYFQDLGSLTAEGWLKKRN